MSFEQYLSEKRIAVPTPENVVDGAGRCYFGTFESEFEKMDFLKADHPSKLPNFMNKSRLTLWEACEIDFDKVTLLTAVCDMALFGTALTVLYDKRTKKCTSWQEMLIPASKAVIAKNLLNGNETFSKGKKVKVRFVNNFQQGKAIVSGTADSKTDGMLDYRVELTRVSKPSIVSIPFGENRPLYSQKDLFSVDGYIDYNGERFHATAASAAIIDDHRGYYPRKSHYDWVTTMGYGTVNGERKRFGFNLTRNQSIDQDDYNENVLWLEGSSERLAPVYFEHLDYDHWRIFDDYGTIDLDYQIHDRNLVKFDLGVAKADYSITFGDLKGFVTGEDGTKYEVDDTGIGEDRSMKLL